MTTPAAHKRKQALKIANAVILACGIFGTWSPWTKSKQDILSGRQPASTMSVSKAGTALQAEIVELSKSDNGDGGYTIELQATVHSAHKTSNVKFVWNLPPGVQVLAGASTGSLGTIEEDSETLTSITVRVASDYNRQIHLHVYHDAAGEPQGQIAQYNTLEQETIDATIRSKAEVLGRSQDENEGSLKIIQ